MSSTPLHRDFSCHFYHIGYRDVLEHNLLRIILSFGYSRSATSHLEGQCYCFSLVLVSVLDCFKTISLHIQKPIKIFFPIKRRLQLNNTSTFTCTTRTWVRGTFCSLKSSSFSHPFVFLIHAGHLRIMRRGHLPLCSPSYMVIMKSTLKHLLFSILTTSLHFLVVLVIP